MYIGKYIDINNNKHKHKHKHKHKYKYKYNKNKVKVAYIHGIVIHCGVVGNIQAFHVCAPGSIPGKCTFYALILMYYDPLD